MRRKWESASPRKQFKSAFLIFYMKTLHPLKAILCMYGDILKILLFLVTLCFHLYTRTFAAIINAFQCAKIIVCIKSRAVFFRFLNLKSYGMKIFAWGTVLSTWMVCEGVTLVIRL